MFKLKKGQLDELNKHLPNITKEFHEVLDKYGLDDLGIGNLSFGPRIENIVCPPCRDGQDPIHIITPEGRRVCGCPPPLGG